MSTQLPLVLGIASSSLRAREPAAAPVVRVAAPPASRVRAVAKPRPRRSPLAVTHATEPSAPTKREARPREASMSTLDKLILLIDVYDPTPADLRAFAAVVLERAGEGDIGGVPARRREHLEALLETARQPAPSLPGAEQRAALVAQIADVDATERHQGQQGGRTR